MSASTAPIGPLSPRHRIRRLDGRTREGKFLRDTEAALVEHAGGDGRVTVPQRLLIRRVAADLLRLEMFDAKLGDGSLTEHDTRVAHALRNSVRLALRAIGLAGAEPRPSGPTFDNGRGIDDILRDEGRQ